MNKNKVMGVLMDPIGDIHYRKDSTLALLLAAQQRGWQLRYLEPADLRVEGDRAVMQARPLQVRMDPTDWFSLGESERLSADDMQVLLMRKDPPFDMEFIFGTYLLEVLQQQGVRIVNNPTSLRDLNEKAALVHFADLAPDFVISRNMAELAAFAEARGGAVLKPLDGMGGQSIYRIRPDDTNTPVILEDLSARGTRTLMAQQYIEQIADGDRRVFVVAGKPAEVMLVRRPAAGELRGNLAAGAQGEVLPLGDTERRIALAVAPELQRRGVLFSGLDIIGDYLSEVNVTSPTGLREAAAAGHDLADDIIAAIED